ncbi:MAG: tetratricopeptide repeat protein [Woeseiaceae bacterium]
MAYSRLLACLVALALVSACSKPSGDTDQAQSETQMDTQSAEAPKAAGKADSIAAHDGGIPLSASDPAAVSQYMAVRRLADRGDFIEANQAARKLTDEHPDYIGGWIMLGNTALSGEQFVKATRKANELSDSGTKGEQLWAAINMSFVTNNTAKGLKLGKKLVDAYPDAPRAWIVYSFLLAGDSQHSEARSAGEKALKLAPDQAVTHNNLGFSYLYNDPKDFALSEQHFQHAIDLDAGEDNYQVNLGDVHRAMGNLEAARNDYSRALEIDAENEVAAVKRGHVNSFLGNFDEARADYDTGIAAGQEGNQSTLANYRAFVNLHAGDYQAAVDELKRELDRVDTLEMPSDQKIGARTFLLTNITDICFNFAMLDDAQAAVTQLSASLAEAGANSGDENYARQQKATAAFWEGKLAARQGDSAAAKAKAEEFAALLADDDNSRKMERYHELLGLMALKQGDNELAIEHYRQANLSTSPGAGDVKNAYMLAKALRAAGNSEEADKLMNTVANWNFNSAWFAMLRKDAAGTS